MLKLRKNKKGFTLVELIVVIAIMAVLAGTIAGVTVSQLNKQTNNTAQNEVDTLIGDFKSFLLDYRLPASKPDEVTLNAGETWSAEDGITTISEMKYALTEFATDAKATKGDEILTEIPTGDNPILPKAGTHKFVFKVETVDSKLKVTFSCQGKGTNAKVIKAEYTYSDVLAG